MPKSNLHGLAAAGVSVWSDQISKQMLDSGELARRVEQDAVTGVTSNPTIFAGAIGGSDDYAAQLKDLRSAGVPTEEIVKSLMADDITRACDVLGPVFVATGGHDGFVSVEVSPTLAADTDATIAEARDWVKQIDRENLLVKVPATAEGVPAIRALIGEGISVNVTLIFSLERYEQVMEAYIAGLEDFQTVGGDLSSVASVASFFVSRFDNEVDRRLDEIGSNDAHDLKGHLAVANARAAYGLFLETFASPRFEDLSDLGARPQKPLWASTSTKNPAYSDLLYVEGLVATDTVNTMPLGTIDAYQDHGDPAPASFDAVDIVRATDQLERLADLGIDYADVVATLEEEGVQKFTASWNELLDKVESAS
ncbi:MAG TPA: transaldolase [Acidimicrobiia bacterium]|nr:transaldolase [Acidimicrobiia bacterium]